MNGTFEIMEPDDIEATLHLTMTIKEWKELRKQLVEKWPASRFGSLITNLLYQMEKMVYEPVE